MKSELKIKEPIVVWDSYELDGEIENVIAKLQGLMKDHPNHFDFTIDINSKSGYYGDSSTEIEITAYRWETDAEFEERMDARQKASQAAKLAAKTKKEANEKRERSLYESLQRKFEKEIDETGKLIKK